MTGDWSLDARVLVRPAQTFQTIAAAEAPSGKRSTFWTAARRPLFLCLVLGCVISLLGANVATIRLIGATAIYWSFVPLVEILALAIVVRGRRGGRTFGSLIDAFFVGHVAWTLFLLLLGAVLVVTPPQYWFAITRASVVGVVLVAGWSAYVDVAFFRYICGATPSSAIGRVVLNRLIVWMLVFWIFAVPDTTPLGVIQEILEAVKELRQ